MNGMKRKGIEKYHEWTGSLASLKKQRIGFIFECVSHYVMPWNWQCAHKSYIGVAL